MEIVEPEMLQSSVLEDALVEGSYRVRVVHASGAGGGEEPGGAWVLGVFSHQQFHRLLGDGDLQDGAFRLGAGDHEITRLIFRSLLADGDGPLFYVQILPLQGHQFAFPNPADQLQIEHSQCSSFLRRVQIGFQILQLQRLHLLVLDFWYHTAVGRIADQQPFLHCPVQGAVERDVDALHC